ncbi:MAG: NADH-quinone oxidoreductase subunit C [Chloroflexi bacterium]|nr:NADH-quinone oxidoreductase subunit C [Chloroflexota bacterium]
MAREPQTRAETSSSPLEPRVREALGQRLQELSYSFDEMVLRIPREEMVECCRLLKTTPGLDFKLLRCLSVVDYVDFMEVVYHLSSLSHPHKVTLKARLPAEDLRVPTVTTVWKGADWHEREGHDLFGVLFEGHPDLSPLLLYEGFEGYPGRKSYPMPEQRELYGE